jgi:DnaJ family protein C protein 7
MFYLTENKRLLQEAKLELKKSKRKDYYKILGVSKTATEDEIKKHYRKRALVHHPGKLYFIIVLSFTLF